MAKNPSDITAQLADDAPRETIIPGTGEYSRIMKADEYREWVRQTVSGTIFRRLTAIFSAVGIATVGAVITYFSSTVTSSIDGKIAAESNRLSSEIDKKLPNIINQELSTQIRTNKLVESITENAVAQVRDKGVETALAGLIIAQSKKILEDTNGSQQSMRALALQQILLFGEDRQKSDAIARVIHDQNSGDQDFLIALQNYPAHQEIDAADRRRSLHSVLSRVARRDTALNAEMWRAIEMIVNRDISEACGWIRVNTSPLMANYSVDSLKTLVGHIAKVGTSSAGEQFVGWLESNDPIPRQLGQHGLNEIDPLEDASKRQALLTRLAKALAMSRPPVDEFADYFSDITRAIRLQDKPTLRRLSNSDIANTRLKALLTQLAREPDNRSRWNFARESLQKPEDIVAYGKYGLYQQNISAHRLLGRLIDTSGNSTDWDRVVTPQINGAGQTWTTQGQASLLVNAWVMALPKSGLPNTASITAAAELFIDAHARNDSNLFVYNAQSYRDLMTRADDALLKRFMDKAPQMVGMSELTDEVRGSEAALLGDVLTKVLREPNIDRIKQARDGFSQDRDQVATERISGVWFAAAKQAAKLEEEGINTISELVERIKQRDNKAPEADVALLALISNPKFLRLKSVKEQAERANLHLFGDDVGRLKSDDIGALAQKIAADAKSAFGWPDNLLQNSQMLGEEPMPLRTNTTWVALDVPLNHMAEMSVDPQVAGHYTLVGSSNRVTSVEDTDAIVDSTGPSRILARSDESGRLFLRIDLADTASANVSLRYLPSWRAADLVSVQKGKVADVEASKAIVVNSRGADEAWVSFKATAQKRYTAQTRSLQKDVDTIIEVYDQFETSKLQEDDDGGSEFLSSRTQVISANDTVYHFRLKNSGNGGSFVFEIVEAP